MNILRRLGLWVRWRRFDADMREELEFHRAEIQRTLEAQGASPDDAARESRRRMGNATLAREDARQIWIARWMDGLRQDVRYALRTFRRDWVFSSVALLTLTLGIGAATAIFSVVYALALRPLPYADSGRLVRINTSEAGRLSLEQYDALLAQTHSLAGVAAARMEVSAFRSASTGDRVRDYTCTLNLFDVLGVKPQLGRTFVSSDADQRVAVLDHTWWAKEFGSDPKILGQSIVLDDVPYQVIGVMPAEFEFPYGRSGQAWIPADAEARAHYGRDGEWLTIGRLRPSMSISTARAELALISNRLADSNPRRYLHRPLSTLPLLEAIIGVSVQTRLFVLLSAVALVLLIACVNVASLLLTRSQARTRELAVRAAIGADRRRLVRQLLTETILMGCLGGAAGVFLAQWMLRAIVGLIPSSVPRIGSIAVDGTVLFVAFALSVGAGITSGLMPAWRVSRRELHDALKDGAPVAAPVGIARVGTWFVFAETSLALVLLIGAGLMIHSFDLLMGVDPGFDRSHLMTITLTLNGPQPPGRIRDLLERARGLHGVTDASGADLVPFFGFTTSTNLQVQGRPTTAFDPSNNANIERVLPGYFQMLGIPLVRGRDFSDRDVEGAPLVALINESAASRYLAGENPIGLRIYGEDGWYQIVGIVKDVKWHSLADDPPPAMYFPLLQSRLLAYSRVTLVTMLVRMNPAMSVSVQDLRAEAANAMGDASISDVQSMDALIARSVQQWKFQAVLLGMFGALALIIAVVGIFGVTSYAVVQRTREIGVRLALGAQRSDMLRLILGSTARPVVGGLVVGLFGAVVATRTLAAFLFQIKSTDAPTYAMTAAIFFVVALIAATIPAYRATLVDPIATLRQD